MSYPQCLHKLHEGGRFKYKFIFDDREWSPDEHRMMIVLYKQFPKNWEMIANVDSKLNTYAQKMGSGITSEEVLQHYQLLSSYECFVEEAQ